jgi:hypothetical protein
MATISEHSTAPIGILYPKQSRHFYVKFNEFSGKLTPPELERLSSQVLSVSTFDAFPKSGDGIRIEMEDDKGGLLDAILAKIHKQRIALDIEVLLLDDGNNILKTIDYGKCYVYADMYSGLTYGGAEDYTSTANVSSSLPEIDVRILEKSEWIQLAYNWLKSIQLSNRVGSLSNQYPATVRRTLSFKKI